MRHAYADSFFQDCPDQNIDAMWAAYADSCRIEELESENAKLREYAAKAWSLFVRHGAVHACDLSEVDAVRDGLRELGVEVGECMGQS